MKRVVGTIVFGSVVLLACSSSSIGGSLSGSGSGTTDGGTSPEAAAPVTSQPGCTSFATAYCQKFSTCSATQLTANYGDLATCTSRLALGCNLSFQAPSTASTNDNWTTCGNDLGAVTCDGLLAGALPPSCYQKGTIADGASCFFDQQCANGFCDLTGVDDCGKCATPKKENESCVHEGQCEPGLICPLAKCIKPKQSGEACDDGTGGNEGQFCILSLGCVNKVCGPPAALGAPCKGEGVCDLFHGQFCSDSGVCTQANYGAPGSPCGAANPDGSVQACGTGGRCENGACVAGGTAGAACNDPSQCLGPSVCAGGVCSDLTAPRCN